MWPGYHLLSKTYIYGSHITCKLKFGENTTNFKQNLIILGYGNTENNAYANALENIPNISITFIAMELPLPTNRESAPSDEYDDDRENLESSLVTWSQLDQELEEISLLRKGSVLKT